MRIFFIGMNKTGTCSLNRFFKHNNIHSNHSFIWTWKSNIQDKKYFELHDNNIFLDGHNANLEWIHRKFPDSLYVYQDRNLNDWLYSRYKMCEKDKKNIYKMV